MRSAARPVFGFFAARGPGQAGSAHVEGTWTSDAGAFHDMEVDHGGGNVLVAEQGLDGADIGALFRQMGCERMAQTMRKTWRRRKAMSLSACFRVAGETWLARGLHFCHRNRNRYRNRHRKPEGQSTLARHGAGQTTFPGLRGRWRGEIPISIAIAIARNAFCAGLAGDRVDEGLFGGWGGWMQLAARSRSFERT
jgi:hypothetical protein